MADYVLLDKINDELEAYREYTDLANEHAIYIRDIRMYTFVAILVMPMALFGAIPALICFGIEALLFALFARKHQKNFGRAWHREITDARQKADKYFNETHNYVEGNMVNLGWRQYL